VEIPTEDEIEEIVQHLYSLHEWGKNLRDIVSAKSSSEDFYQERSYHGHLKSKSHSKSWTSKAWSEAKSVVSSFNPLRS